MNRDDGQEHGRGPQEARQAEGEPQMSEARQAQGGRHRPALDGAVELSGQHPAQHEGGDGQDEHGERGPEHQRGGLEQRGHGYGREPGLAAIQVSR